MNARTFLPCMTAVILLTAVQSWSQQLEMTPPESLPSASLAESPAAGESLIRGNSLITEPRPAWNHAPTISHDPWSTPDGFHVFEPACGPSPRWWVPHSFTGQVVFLSRTRSNEDWLLLARGDIDPITLAVDVTPAVYASDLTVPTEIGVRGSVFFGQVAGCQIELAYLGIFDQQTTVRFAEAADDVRVTFFDQQFVTTDTDLSTQYEADLHTAEANLWCDDGWPIQAMVGARWFQLSEELEQFETLNLSDRALTGLDNDLAGAQVGLRASLFQHGRLSLITIGKGGLYSNQVRLAGDVQSGGATLATLQHSDRTMSYSGEIDVSAIWQFTPWFSMNLGYTGLWFTNVASLDEQLNQFSSVTGSGTLEYDGVSYQGGHFGLTLAW